MKADKRITKKRIKEDRLVSTTFKATEYIQKNQMPFVIGTIGIVVIFALVVYMRWNSERKRNEAAGILTRAEIIAGMDDLNQYYTDLGHLSDNFGSTPAGKLATLRLASSFFENKDYPNAEKYFKRILDHYSDDVILSAGAAAGLGAIYEIQENYRQAGDNYRRAAELSDGESWAATYLLKAGLNLSKAGDKEQAAAAFKQIEEKYQNSTEFSAARRALAELSQ
jgi:predicted negative regulator of RcsB-dependent stress response